MSVWSALGHSLVVCSVHVHTTRTTSSLRDKVCFEAAVFLHTVTQLLWGRLSLFSQVKAPADVSSSTVSQPGTTLETTPWWRQTGALNCFISSELEIIRAPAVTELSILCFLYFRICSNGNDFPPSIEEKEAVSDVNRWINWACCEYQWI